jgi:hypothetical protein
MSNKLGEHPVQLWDLQQWYKSEHIATLRYMIPYPLARRLKQREEINAKYPRGTYFKLVLNKQTI